MSAEDDLIARHFSPIAGPGGLNLRDDAALLAVGKGEELVVTKDVLVAGVHFFADDPPGAVARKALRVNLSDLAAKAARPEGFLLGLMLPQSWGEQERGRWLAAFALALGEDAQAHRCTLLGGDTVATPGPLAVSITAFGVVPGGRMPLRSGARPGDVLLVSGTVGDAALGLKLRLKADAPWTRALGVIERRHLTDRYLHPQPRNALAPALLAHAAATMDVSDGLVGDCAKLLATSGCGGRLELDALPLSPAARKVLSADPSLIEVVATGGDDYEVLCASRPEEADALIAMASQAGVALTVIGQVTEAAEGFATWQAGAPVTFAKQAYSHV